MGNVVCPGSRIVTEIQLHFEPLSKYKKISHTMYKRARLFERETENLAYKYSTQYLRPKIGSKAYEPSKDDMVDDDEKENETKAVKSFDVLLKEWGLEKYIDKMQDEGWDDPEDWQEITDDELQKHIGFSRGHIKKWHRKFNEWNEIGANKKEAEELERQRKMQEEEDRINAKRKAVELEQQRKEREAKAKEEEKRRKLKELEEEKEDEMERQKKRKIMMSGTLTVK